MKQLSGGQRTVVAVALMLSVLRMEGAPYYILDEIDAALDEKYRQAISQVIEQLSAKS